MSPTDNRADARLPVTAEVGSEGGSYADLKARLATFEGHELPRARPTNDARQPAVGTETASGMRRYPTEPPPPPALETTARAWRAGLLGAAAGAAAGAVVAFGLMKHRDRREG